MAAQNNVSRNHSADDLHDAVSNALYYVKEALSELRGFGEYEEWFNTLDDLQDEMQDEILPLEAQVSADYDAEMAALTRDYYKSVL